MMVWFLYVFNVAIIYLVIWSLASQVTKVFTQTMALEEGDLVLSRKQIIFSFPILRELGLQIPVSSIEEINLQQTRVGYFLITRFNQDGKTMGVDLDINPLKGENKVILEQILKLNSKINVDEGSLRILEKYKNEALSWKASYTLSFFVIALALIIFPVITIMLGSKL